MPVNPTQGPIYESYTMLHPTGVTMCRCTQEKAHWYVSRKLANWVDKKTFQLTFVPKGKGKSNDPYYLQGIANQCVVCGATTDLNRHHVVPRVFRVHYPDSYKNNTSHDVLPLCGQCHATYELEATKFKARIALQYGILIRSQKTDPQHISDIRRVLSARAALAKYSARIPQSKRDKLIVLAETPLPTDLDKSVRHYGDAGAEVVKAVAQKNDLFAFVRAWRSHFIETMNPQYMPKYWSVDRNETNL